MRSSYLLVKKVISDVPEERTLVISDDSGFKHRFVVRTLVRIHPRTRIRNDRTYLPPLQTLAKFPAPLQQFAKISTMLT
ncbi:MULTISPECIES: hypothetical protein [unclassified Microcoleus]|uniref:hypothetical protein n=1 Tax=unclassified Microcoleus TaxID=2642155 RepID=UPI0025FCFAAC|nr:MULTISPECIES: hypothetical protein [unclassified Microcoleus]